MFFPTTTVAHGLVVAVGRGGKLPVPQLAWKALQVGGECCCVSCAGLSRLSCLVFRVARHSLGRSFCATVPLWRDARVKRYMWSLFEGVEEEAVGFSAST